jgi:Asp/Glu/hydantoin racemase
MRLLIVNSNTTGRVTELIAEEAQRVAAAGTEIVAVTASIGPATIECRAEATIAAYGTLHAIAENAEGAAAAVIACFSDPGLSAARELFPFPVTGIAEAAMLTACQLGSRFSIVTVGERSRTSLWELTRSYGLESRLASIRTLERTVAAVAESQSDSFDELLQLCEQAVRQDRADVIILGGAVMAGMPGRMSERLSIPVLDGVSCGVKQAELLYSLRPSSVRRHGSYQPPAKKDLRGVPASLAAFFSCL